MKELVNSEIQNELLEMMGSEGLRDLVREAAVEFHEHLGPLQSAMHDADWLQVRPLAHKLKGLMGSLGYERLYTVLHDLEQQLRAVPPLIPAAAQIAEIDQTVADTQLALEVFEV